MRWTTCLALAAAAALSPGCVRDHCDPGMRYDDQVCVFVPDAAPAPAPGGGTDAAPAAAGGDGGLCNATGGGFGDPCTTVAQCGCPTDTCDTYMGANRCTRVNCKGNPAICPAGWMCLDLTAFGQPSICIKN